MFIGLFRYGLVVIGEFFLFCLFSLCSSGDICFISYIMVLEYLFGLDVSLCAFSYCPIHYIQLSIYCNGRSWLFQSVLLPYGILRSVWILKLFHNSHINILTSSQYNKDWNLRLLYQIICLISLYSALLCLILACFVAMVVLCVVSKQWFTSISSQFQHCCVISKKYHSSSGSWFFALYRPLTYIQLFSPLGYMVSKRIIQAFSNLSLLL